MKCIDSVAEYTIDGKNIIIVSDNYNGCPLIYHKYDVLIGSQNTIKRFFKELVPKHQIKSGWHPKFRFI